MVKYSELKSNDRQNLRDIIPLPKPFTLVVEPSSLCNFRCAMCFQSTRVQGYFYRNKRNMSLELFDLIIRQMREWEGDKLKVLKLSLYGEPLVNPDFCEMLSTARDAEIAERIETTSNVSLLTPEICEGLVRGGLDYIRVSIYSPLQDRHEQITSSSIKIDSIRKNLELLQEIKVKNNSKTPFVAVKMLDTYGEENELFREMYKDVADEIYIDKPHNWVPTEEKSFLDSLYGAESGAAKRDLEESSNNNYACGPSFYIMSVRSNGDISPCCIDWRGGTNVANIYETPLKEAWQGEPMREFWRMQLQNRKHENPSCRCCEFYKSSYYSRDCVDGVDVSRL